jgi:Zn-dependent membrane protease YugP
MVWIILIVILLAAVLGPSIWVKHVLARYSKPEDRYPGTGASLARHLLDRNNLQSVKVEATESGDHYDPIAKAVRLSPGNHDGHSLTAITVAAHGVGHAIQDATAYGPLRWRTRLVRLTGPIERMGAGFLLISPFLAAFTRIPALGVLTFGAGFLILASSVIVHSVTLPTEFDASFNRALPLLEKHDILKKNDKPHASRILKAAALTYVSAALMSLLNIARWMAILRR